MYIYLKKLSVLTRKNRNSKQYKQYRNINCKFQRVAKNFHGWNVIENKEDDDDELDPIDKSLSPRCLPWIETVSTTAANHLVIRLAKSSQGARMSFITRETTNIYITFIVTVTFAVAI